MVQSSTTLEKYSTPITVEYLPSAKPMLTPKVRQVIEGARAIFERLSNEAGIGPSIVGISGHTSPEDGSRTVFLTQIVDMEPELALDHWNRIATKYYQWIVSLSPELEKVARERVSVAVWWTE